MQRKIYCLKKYFSQKSVVQAQVQPFFIYKARISTFFKNREYHSKVKSFIDSMLIKPEDCYLNETPAFCRLPAKIPFRIKLNRAAHIRANIFTITSMPIMWYICVDVGNSALARHCYLNKPLAFLQTTCQDTVFIFLWTKWRISQRIHHRYYSILYYLLVLILLNHAC